MFTCFFLPPVVSLTKGVVVNQENPPASQHSRKYEGFGGKEYITSQTLGVVFSSQNWDLNG